MEFKLQPLEHKSPLTNTRPGIPSVVSKLFVLINFELGCPE